MHRGGEAVKIPIEFPEQWGARGPGPIQLGRLQAGQHVARRRRGMWMHRTAIIVLVTCLSGCVIRLDGVSRWQPAIEDVYQAASAVDFAQTVNIARRHDCYNEIGRPTRLVIGSKPSVGRVWAWWAVQASAHAAISDWLLREADANGDSPAWYYVWEAATLGYTGYNIMHASADQLRPFGDQASPLCWDQARWESTH